MDVWLAAAQRQRSHGELVNLSAGQPSAGAPGPVRAAAAAALEHNQLGYTVALGIPELRDAIAASYRDRYGLAVDLDDVVVTTGSSGGFLLTFLACFDAGDRVAIAAYLGNGDTFDRAICDFANAYADLNELDYKALSAAVKSGRIAAAKGL